MILHYDGIWRKKMEVPKKNNNASYIFKQNSREYANDNLKYIRAFAALFSN